VTASALYRGTLLHTRRDEHAQRTFRYPVYVAAIDPRELPALDANLRLFSHNRRHLFELAGIERAGRAATIVRAIEELTGVATADGWLDHVKPTLLVGALLKRLGVT